MAHMVRTRKPPNRTRTQIVFFRVSPEEYNLMQTASRATGSDSLSSFARLAVLFWLEGHMVGGSVLENDIHSLQAKLMDFKIAFDEFVRRSTRAETGGEAGDVS